MYSLNSGSTTAIKDLNLDLLHKGDAIFVLKFSTFDSPSRNLSKKISKNRKIKTVKFKCE